MLDVIEAAREYKRSGAFDAYDSSDRIEKTLVGEVDTPSMRGGGGGGGDLQAAEGSAMYFDIDASLRMRRQYGNLYPYATLLSSAVPVDQLW